jgi:hypothetical protein
MYAIDKNLLKKIETALKYLSEKTNGLVFNSFELKYSTLLSSHTLGSLTPSGHQTNCGRNPFATGRSELAHDWLNILYFCVSR